MKKGKFQSKYIVSLIQLKKKKKFCNKSQLVSSKFEKVKFRWNQVSVVMATQNFKRNLQPSSSIWRPLAFLPVTLSIS